MIGRINGGQSLVMNIQAIHRALLRRNEVLLPYCSGFTTKGQYVLEK